MRYIYLYTYTYTVYIYIYIYRCCTYTRGAQQHCVGAARALCDINVNIYVNTYICIQHCIYIYIYMYTALCRCSTCPMRSLHWSHTPAIHCTPNVWEKRPNMLQKRPIMCEKRRSNASKCSISTLVPHSRIYPAPMRYQKVGPTRHLLFYVR
jgi:hypothetical protein